MSRTMLLDHLALIERYIRESERHLLHQREIVIELEHHGRCETAKTGRVQVATQQNSREQLG